MAAAGGPAEGPRASAGDTEQIDGPRVVCRVCTRQFSRYTCPRCNARYCSLACYKKHSAQCTEGFYRDNAVEALKGQTADSEQRRALLDILRRVHERDAGGAGLPQGARGSDSEEDGPDQEVEVSDGEEGGLSEETMQRLLRRAEAGEEAEITAEDLSPEDFEAFQQAVASGALSHLIERWEPWWESPAARGLRLTSRGNALVTAAGEASGVAGPSQEPSTVPPAPSEPLPRLEELLGSRPPSPLLRWHLLDILYAYTCALRQYNGDYAADPPGAAALLVDLSAVLAGDEAGADAPCSTPQALVSSVSRASSRFGLCGRAPAVLGCCDVSALVGAGKGAVVCALWDARRLITATLEELMLDRKDVQEVGSKSTRGRQRPKGRKRLLQAVHHKLLFFASWANELSSDDLGSLANHCRERWREMEATLVAPRPGASGLAEAAFEGLNLSRGEASPPPAGSHTTIEEIPSGND